MNPSYSEVREAGAHVIRTTQVSENPRETSTTVTIIIVINVLLYIRYLRSDECRTRLRHNTFDRHLYRNTIAPNIVDDRPFPAVGPSILAFYAFYVLRPGGMVAADRVAGFSLWLSSCMSVTYEAPHRSR